MTIDVGDVIQLVMTWDTPLASVAQNVWHMQMVSGAGADEADILAAVETQLQVAFTDIDGFIADDFEAVTLEGFVRDVALHQWDGFGAEVLSSMIGLSTGDYEPHGVAAVCRWFTESLRRQGRIFLPGLVETAIVGGVISASPEADLALFMADFMTDISVTGGLLTLCTYNVEPLSALYESASLAIGVAVINSLPGYQRRRKPGVGL